MRSLTLKGSFNLSRPPDAVFRLFSPLGEKDWVPGWNPEILYPVGATWEEGLIFRTQEERGGNVVWIVNKLDPASHLVVYHRVESDRYVARITVRCAAAGARTEVLTEYTFIALSEKGNREIAEMTQDSYNEKMSRWANWINHYFEQTQHSRR